MDVVLYGNTETNAWRVQWMLNELNVPYQHIAFDIHGEGVESDPIYLEIAQLNPHAAVPVLKHGDDVVWDSLAINLYLADTYRRLCPQAGMIPAVQWSLWAAGLEESLRTAQSHHARLPEGERDAELATNARGLLSRPLDRLDAWLDQKEYLVDGVFTIADVNVICVLARIVDSGFEENRWPQLERWMRACGARQALTSVF